MPGSDCRRPKLWVCPTIATIPALIQLRSSDLPAAAAISVRLPLLCRLQSGAETPSARRAGLPAAGSRHCLGPGERRLCTYRLGLSTRSLACRRLFAPSADHFRDNENHHGEVHASNQSSRQRIRLSLAFRFLRPCLANRGRLPQMHRLHSHEPGEAKACSLAGTVAVVEHPRLQRVYVVCPANRSNQSAPQSQHKANSILVAQTRFSGSAAFWWPNADSNSKCAGRGTSECRRYWIFPVPGRYCRRPKLRVCATRAIACYRCMRMPFRTMLRKLWITSSWMALG